MRFEDLNWMDIENYLKGNDRIILIFGACEQHGYLSLLSDVKIPLALADAASKQTGIPVAPPLNFGSSPYFLSYPGTLSLRVSTLLDAAEDIVRSAHRAGFRRFLVLNGHGGNDPIRARLSELAGQLSGTRFAWYAWWTAASVAEVATKHGLIPYHASWSEAFPFTRVADLPSEEKRPVPPPGIIGPEQSRQVYGDGVFGGPYKADDPIMEELFATALQDILALLKFD